MSTQVENATAPSRLTPAEAAVEARRHPDTVYAALESGTLHGSQRVKGGRWLIRPACLDAWLDGQPCEHKAPTNVVSLDAARRSRTS